VFVVVRDEDADTVVIPSHIDLQAFFR
jgi:hypothetical protein